MTRQLSTYILLVIIVITQCTASAQFAEHYDARTFWGANNIYHIVPDRNGFLWFSTSNGLIQFDGSTLKRFDEHNGLPDNTVYNSYEDNEGRIWPFCGNAAIAYLHNGQVFQRENDPWLQTFPKTESYINYMTEGDSGDYYFATHGGTLFHWTGKNSKTRQLELGEGFVFRRNRIETSATYRERFAKFYGDKKIACDGNIFKIYKGSTLIWQLRDSVLAKSTNDICLTPDGSLVIAAFTGALLIDLKTNTRADLLPGVEATGCTVDFQGNIWVSTTYDGVYRFHPALFAIQNEAIPDSGRWVQTPAALLLLSNSGRLQQVMQAGSSVRLRQTRFVLSGHHVPLWIKNDKLAFFDPLKYEFVIRSESRILQRKTLLVKKVFEWQDTLLTIEANSVGLWAQSAGQYKNYWHSPTLTDKRITGSVADSLQGQMYMVAGDQLIRFSFRDKKIELLVRDAALRGAQELCISGGQILITARTSAILSFDLKKGTLSKHVVPERITLLFPLANRDLLMRGSVDDYLVHDLRFEQATTIRYPFSLKHQTLFSLHPGQILNLGAKRITAFASELLNQRQFPVKLYLQRLLVNGKEYRKNKVDLGVQSSLNIQLSLGVLNFSSGVLPLQYRVCTATDTGSWTRMQGTDLNISLLKIAPYQIQVAFAEGAAFQNVLTISLKAQPPFFKSKNFYLLAVLLLLAIIISVVFWDTRRRKRRYRRELEYLKLEHRSINALLNPHFLFNAISNIQGLINKSEKHLATEYLAVLSRLMRQNLENLKENLIPLDDEITLVERYIRLQNLRFSDRIQLHIDNKLQSGNSIVIPPLLIHTFVENAIVHGFRPGTGSFIITIILEPVDSDYASIIIRDNGVGYHPKPKTNNNTESSSLGFSFNRKRLERISGIFGLRQSIRVKDLSPDGGQGTQVDIILYRHLSELQENWNAKIRE